MWKLRCLKPVLTRDQMKLGLETLVLTQLYYMSIVWGSAAKKYLRCINKIIKDAHYLLDNGLSTSMDSEWLFIDEMHKYQSLVLSHASIQKCTPPCFFNIINCEALKTKNTRSGEVHYVEKSMCIDYIQHYMSKQRAQLNSKTRAIERKTEFKSVIRKEIFSIRKRDECECDCETNCLDDVLNYVQNLYKMNNSLIQTTL